MSWVQIRSWQEIASQALRNHVMTFAWVKNIFRLRWHSAVTCPLLQGKARSELPGTCTHSPQCLHSCRHRAALTILVCSHLQVLAHHICAGSHQYSLQEQRRWGWKPSLPAASICLCSEPCRFIPFLPFAIASLEQRRPLTCKELGGVGWVQIHHWRARSSSSQTQDSTSGNCHFPDELWTGCTSNSLTIGQIQH